MFFLFDTGAVPVVQTPRDCACERKPGEWCPAAYCLRRPILRGGATAPKELVDA